MSNDKFVSKEGEMQLLRNSDLDCKNCVFANKDDTIVAHCIIYQQEKPSKVLSGGTCNEKCISMEEAKNKYKK